ncbi:unnamed protein product [Phytophthora fragariaefolia]|uniref:Unnamed protein product n=1 Tax=Phytophthora fragariaefolia TaxID=1490495 RepID=A0A9W6TLN1_9STRA|nr:unnamed protein product [Phytophthora fragariaefolia]
MMAYSSTTTTLESASAPQKKDVSNPPTGSSGWVNRRATQTESKPRARLAATEKKMKLADERRKPASPVKKLYALRERRATLSEHSLTSPQLFSLRAARPTRLGKRKLSSEGSAAKPIALDSDSDSDVEVQRGPGSPDKNVNIVDEVLNDTRNKKSPPEDLEEKTRAVESEDIISSAVVKIHNCDVMIGLFQCVIDLFFQNDRMCMRNIRGKYDRWPFKSSYTLGLERVQDVRYAKLWRFYVVQS